MALEIAAANTVDRAYQFAESFTRHRLVAVEWDGIGDFLWKELTRFLHYETYYHFDPYRETTLPPASVQKIRQFADSICQYLSEIDVVEENRIVGTYGVIPSKIQKFAAKLSTISAMAEQNGWGLVGLGD